jgi:CRISPR system Cascade subunit CasE
MTLHMVQLAPDMRRLARWADGQGQPAHGEVDFGYALHGVLTAAFGPLAPKPFALLHHPRREPDLLGYTTHDAICLRDHAASFAAPEIAAVLRLDRLAAKAMPENFAPGRRLGFTLRARPTQRADRDGERDLVVEKDAFLAPEGSDRGEVYAAWLARRLEEGGARPIRVALDGFQLTRVRRRRTDRKFRETRGPEANFSGVLEVADPAAFASLLARGVGRHRAIRFGMLLLRPA